MNSLESLFHENLVFMHIQYTDQRAFFTQIARTLYQEGFVEGSFLEAISKREEEFPTGLHVAGCDVAIPHTDPVHIKKKFIAVVVPETPVPFKAMGTTDDQVQAKLILVLGFNKDGEQIGLLKKLMSLFMQREIMLQLLQCRTATQILQEIKQYFSESVI